MNDESLRLQIEGQITGFRNHIRHLHEPHRRVETNTRRALGHAQEAIRLALKLRRLKNSNKDVCGERSESVERSG